jgi:hypothetical protein
MNTIFLLGGVVGAREWAVALSLVRGIEVGLCGIWPVALFLEQEVRPESTDLVT